MSLQRFQAELYQGHSDDLAVVVPFVPSLVWDDVPERPIGYRKHVGVAVRGTVAGLPFEPLESSPQPTAVSVDATSNKQPITQLSFSFGSIESVLSQSATLDTAHTARCLATPDYGARRACDSRLSQLSAPARA